MRTFKNGNWGFSKVCPICGTDKSGEVVLIPIYGTQEGKICEGEQIHLECLDLTYYKKEGVIIMKVKGDK